MMTTHTTWTLLYVINIEMDGGEDACVPCTTLPLCYTHYPNNDDSSACVRTVDLEYVQRKRYFHNIFHTTTNRYYYLLIFIKLHHTTLHHTTPHHTALHCTTLHNATLHYTTLNYTIHAGITGRDEYEKVSRDIRYGFYTQVLSSTGCAGVIFGHHLGDVQENVISNVMR